MSKGQEAFGIVPISQKVVEALVKEREELEHVDTQAKTKPLTPRLSLLEQEFLFEMAKVMDFGTRKYAEEDWRDNPKVTVKGRLDSLFRHAGKFSSDLFDDLDADTSVSHLVAVAVNAMICWWIAKHRPERDDRYRQPSAVNKGAK